MDDTELTRRFGRRDSFNAIIKAYGIEDKLHVDVDDRGYFQFSTLFPMVAVWQTQDEAEALVFIKGFRIGVDN